jgi:hypothetical protein
MIKLLHTLNFGKDEYSMLEQSLTWKGTMLKDGREFKQNVQMKSFWDTSTFILNDDMQLPDYFVSGGMVIVSTKFMNLVKSFQEDGIEFLPIQVMGLDGRYEREYFFMNVYKSVNCIDLDKSDCEITTLSSGVSYVSSIKKVVLKKVDLSGIHIFIPKEYSYLFISDLLAVALVKSLYTGFFFGTLSDPFGESPKAWQGR